MSKCLAELVREKKQQKAARLSAAAASEAATEPERLPIPHTDDLSTPAPRDPNPEPESPPTGEPETSPPGDAPGAENVHRPDRVSDLEPKQILPNSEQATDLDPPGVSRSELDNTAKGCQEEAGKHADNADSTSKFKSRSNSTGNSYSEAPEDHKPLPQSITLGSLAPGDYRLVFSCAENPSEMYLHPEQNLPEVRTATELAQLDCSSYEHVPCEVLKPGVALLAYSSRHDGWYRANVLKVLKDTLEVFLVDFGDTVRVPVKHCRRLPATMSMISAPVVKFTLPGFTHAAFDRLRTQLTEKLRSILPGPQILDAQITLSKDGTHFGALYLKSGECINDIMHQFALGLFPSPSQAPLLLLPASVLPGQPFAGTLAYAADPLALSAHVHSDWSVTTLAHIRALTADPNIDRLPPYTPKQPGELVLGRHVDKRWYRCRCNSRAGNSVFVTFVDWGNCATLTPTDMRQMEHSLTQIPPMSVPCKLERVVGPMNGLFTPDTSQLFFQLSVHYHNIDGAFQIQICGDVDGSDGGRYPCRARLVKPAAGVEETDLHCWLAREERALSLCDGQPVYTAEDLQDDVRRLAPPQDAVVEPPETGGSGGTRRFKATLLHNLLESMKESCLARKAMLEEMRPFFTSYRPGHLVYYRPPGEDEMFDGFARGEVVSQSENTVLIAGLELQTRLTLDVHLVIPLLKARYKLCPRSTYHCFNTNGFQFDASRPTQNAVLKFSGARDQSGAYEVTSLVFYEST